MKRLIFALSLLLSSSAFAKLVNTVQCPDGQTVTLSYEYHGQIVPGYFVADDRYWNVAGLLNDGDVDVVEFHARNRSSVPDRLICTVTSYRANP